MTLAASYRPNLPPLFADDDWLWIAQSLAYIDFNPSDPLGPWQLNARHRMDRIIAKIIEYRAEDVRQSGAHEVEEAL